MNEERAVSGTDEDEYGARTLDGAAGRELGFLWDDLDAARNHAMNGDWSTECDDVAERIKMFTRLIGVTPWEKVPMTLLENGVYQRIHAEMGVDAEVDMEQVARIRAGIEEQR
jgi:hypothetical protein